VSSRAPSALTIAAASDLRFALADIIRGYEANHSGVKVKATFGSSGNFYAQLSNGANFDVFLSADIAYPTKLAEAKIADEGSVFAYATGAIVVWARVDGPVDPSVLKASALTDGRVRKIAIANPEHAPYGRAAVAAMRAMGVYDAAAARLVMGDGVSQAMQFVESGAADVGVVALALAVAPTLNGKGRYWEIPRENYPPITQGAAIMKAAKNPGGATDFCAYLKTPEARAVLERYGFATP